MTQSSKPKETTSSQTSSLADNTRTTTTQAQLSGSNEPPKRPRKRPTTTRIGSRSQTRQKEMVQVQEERGKGTMRGAQPSQMTRNPAQGKDGHKKRKYETKDLDITLTWDDAELVADKVEDMSEEVV